MIKREHYINQLKGFIDKPFIKVITGLRRSGKSSVLMLLKDELLKKGITEDQIIYINFESFQFFEIKTADTFYTYIQSKVPVQKNMYLLIDEIQEVTSWEKAINSILVDYKADIYITGSNSKLLSSELATYLTGRYIEIHLYTLSFQEYLLFHGKKIENAEQLQRDFQTYIKIGGFPALHVNEYTADDAYKIVYDIYSSAILRDTIQRFNIRDIELLERVVKFIFDNIGNKFSAKTIADYFKNQFRKIDLNTIYNYINALESAFIIYRVSRFDVKGKEILKTNEKFFAGDLALVYAVMGFKDRQISGIMENIIFLELKCRGYKVYVGKYDNTEIDFIAENNSNKVYIQVTYILADQTTIDREFKPLLSIKDNHPKYVVSMDPSWQSNYEGIHHKHISDFLLMEKY